MANWVSLYHRFPYPLRVLAASGRGFYLRSWRYGPETGEEVERTLARENWSRQQWKTWQDERLACLLHRAATMVPYYREQWAERRRKGDRASWDLLENWPILTKEPVRASPKAFLAEDCDLRKMSVEFTSGTTGKPMTLFRSRETVRTWYALNEARVKNWNGVSRHDRWAILGGQLVTQYQQEKPPFWVWNISLNQLYLSSYHINPRFGEDYRKAMIHYGVTYLLGYPSAMTALAQIFQESGFDAPKLRVALSNAEQLYQHQRDLIGEVFHCPVVDTYGMVETVAAASECDARGMHIWPEVGIIEVVDDDEDRPLASGEVGRFICTGLLNLDMPLIRYEVGDRGAVSSLDAYCACGRTLPMIQQVEGRMDDVVLTPDGRRVGRLGPVFRGELPVRQAQIIQERIDFLRVKVVPAPEYTAKTDQAIRDRLRDRVGNMEIEIETVEAIPKSANGKTRVIVSQLPK